MLLVAVTGGIASGKSAVAARLAEHGAVVVDADQVARDVVAPGAPALARIAEEFGPDVLTSDGALDRARVGEIVFADPEKRAVLNAITHPAVLEESHRRFRAARDADPDAVVVYDIPLLVEAGRHEEFDVVVAVEAGIETRIGRMTTLRGMTAEEATRRIAAQASDDDRRAIADVEIDANGTLDETLAQTDALWENLRTRVGSSA